MLFLRIHRRSWPLYLPFRCTDTRLSPHVQPPLSAFLQEDGPDYNDTLRFFPLYHRILPLLTAPYFFLQEELLSPHQNNTAARLCGLQNILQAQDIFYFLSPYTALQEPSLQSHVPDSPLFLLLQTSYI